MTLKHYRYPLEDKEGKYYGEYTIKEGVKSLDLPGEELVETYEVDIK